jgi:phage terminase small subunit
VKIKTYNKQDYEILTVGEADRLGIKYSLLSEFDDDVKYLLSEDGYVIPVIKHDWIGGTGKYPIILTPYGRINRKARVHTEDWFSGMDGKGDLTEKQKKFADIFIATRDRAQAYGMAYDTNADHTLLYRKGTELLKLEKVKSYVDKETREAAERLGLTKEFVLEHLKDIIEVEHGKDKLGAVKELSEILEMKQKLTVKASYNLPLSAKDMELLDREKQKVLGQASYEVLDEKEVNEAETEPDRGTESGVSEEDVS